MMMTIGQLTIIRENDRGSPLNSVFIIISCALASETKKRSKQLTTWWKPVILESSTIEQQPELSQRRWTTNDLYSLSLSNTRAGSVDEVHSRRRPKSLVRPSSTYRITQIWDYQPTPEGAEWNSVAILRIFWLRRKVGFLDAQLRHRLGLTPFPNPEKRKTPSSIRSEETIGIRQESTSQSRIQKQTR